MNPMDRLICAKHFKRCIEDGLNIIQTLAACHAAGFDADVTNGMMDDFADKYNTSPLEYNDNLNENRSALIDCMKALIEQYEKKQEKDNA